VRTEETTLGNLTADANLAAARLHDPTVVASIKSAERGRRALSSPAPAAAKRSPTISRK